MHLSSINISTSTLYLFLQTFLLINQSFRVEELSRDVTIHVDLGGLRNSIKNLQQASFDLDKEKAKAERLFRRLLRKLHKPRRPRHCHRIINWIESILPMSMAGTSGLM